MTASAHAAGDPSRRGAPAALFTEQEASVVQEHEVREIREIASNFRFAGAYLGAERCENGHINDTYIVATALPGGGVRRYVLQRINHNVFKSPEDVMQNIRRVTQHLRRKVIERGGDPEREIMNLVPTRDESFLYKSESGEYWRSYLYVEGARTYNAVEEPRHFFGAGEAFGRFQSLLSDFPAETLIETIPKFHDTPSRLKDLVSAVERDAANRAKDVKQEIEFALERAGDAPVVVDLLAQGEIPLRVTHNDTKLNNVLIDEVTGQGICVLDLDTVMPGSTLYDFGDAIRFGASTAAEDERDLSKVGIDLDLYRQFTRGYLSTASDFLTERELELLPFSAKLLAYELGMRFLTDHLNGDVYFRIHRPNHNLDRARAQFRLAESIEQHMDEMLRIVEEESARVPAERRS